MAGSKEATLLNSVEEPKAEDDDFRVRGSQVILDVPDVHEAINVANLSIEQSQNDQNSSNDKVDSLSESDRESKSLSKSNSIDSSLDAELASKRDKPLNSNPVLIRGASWNVCNTPSPSASLDKTELQDTYSQADFEDSRDVVNANFGSPIQTGKEAGTRYSFTDSMQMSYSRHRRATSREMKLTDSMSPSATGKNLARQTVSASQLPIYEETSPSMEKDPLSVMALESCVHVTSALGPRIAAKTLLDLVLNQVIHWFEVSRLSIDNSSG